MEQDIQGTGAAHRLAPQRPGPGPLLLRQRLAVLIPQVKPLPDLMERSREALGAPIHAEEFPGRGILVHDTAFAVEDDDAIGHRLQDRSELAGRGLRRVALLALLVHLTALTCRFRYARIIPCRLCLDAS